jgi:hypothetical protein
MNSADKVAKACAGMEPIEPYCLTEVEAKGVEITALQSIAISLKRIADKLELSQKQPIVMTAEDYKKVLNELGREL